MEVATTAALLIIYLMQQDKRGEGLRREPQTVLSQHMDVFLSKTMFF